MSYDNDSLLNLTALVNSIRDNANLDITETEAWKYCALTLPYVSTNDKPKPEVREMRINPKEFVYSRYTRYLNGGSITEDEAREEMTDYYYENHDPLIFRSVRKHYYFAGPDAETSPTKRKFYNCVNWYRDYYDGRHGQKTDIDIDEVNLNEWDGLIIAMVVSGDYTLRESMYIVANACDRCRHALLWKYKDLHKRTDGYSETSQEYINNRHRCKFCNYY